MVKEDMCRDIRIKEGEISRDVTNREEMSRKGRAGRDEHGCDE
jgi:hypothetical protein